MGLKELEGLSPLSFNANGEPLLDWAIEGHTSANIFDKVVQAESGLDPTTGLPISYSAPYARCAIRYPQAVTDNTYTLSFVSTVENTKFMYSCFNGDTLVRRVVGKYSGDTIDCSDGDSLYICWYCNDSSVAPSNLSSIMLNSGESALPYEPTGKVGDLYGSKYKITVQCGGESTLIVMDSQLGTGESLSMTDTSVSIPTVNGSNTFAVVSTVQPSSVYIKYQEGGDEMVTLAKIGSRYNTPLLEIRGLSTDTKPTTEIEGMIVVNGSTYIEIDTGDTYMFDAENGVWHNITG